MGIIQSIFSDHNGMKLGINNREIWETHRYVETKQYTASPVVKEETTRKLENVFNNKCESTTY